MNKNDHELIETNKVKLIGWGTGSTFSKLMHIEKLNLAYCVDKTVNETYTHANGISIRHANELVKEDPSNVIIVVFSSFFNEVVAQIKEYGDYKVVDALTYVREKLYNNNLHQLAKVIDSSKLTDINLHSKKSEHSRKYGILIQGPIVPEVTHKVVQFYSAIHPNVYILVSTWDDTPSSLLDNIYPYANQILLNKKPEFAGRQNRNMLITSTLNGLKELHQIGIGIEYVLKTRADMVIKNEQLFTQSLGLLNKYPVEKQIRNKLKSRIIIPKTYTRKHYLYHPSDMNMIGHIDDLLSFWNIPLEPTDFHPEQKKLEIITPLDCLQRLVYPEIYFGNFFKTYLNNNYEDTLEDSWRYFKEAFIVTDDNFFDLFWFKWPIIPASKGTIDNEFWLKLQTNAVSPSDYVDINEIYIIPV